MTTQRAKLIEDAEKAGYTVVIRAGTTRIYKTCGRWNESRGIDICEDGTALRIDVRADIAKGMRSYKDMREVLGI